YVEKSNLSDEFAEKFVSSETEFKNYATTVLKRAHGEDFNEDEASEMINGIISDYKKDKIKTWGEAIGILQGSLKNEGKTYNEETIKESNKYEDEYTLEKDSLNNLYKSILEEHHLETREEKIEYILDNVDTIKDMVEGENKEKAIKNMTDVEIDNLYNKVEEELGVKK
ncbi:MAG: hypothetical protein ACOC3V_03695, partial [bacterium]